MTELLYELHIGDGNSTTIRAETDTDALNSAAEVAAEVNQPVEVYRIGKLGDIMDTLVYIGSRP